MTKRLMATLIAIAIASPASSQIVRTERQYYSRAPYFAMAQPWSATAQFDSHLRAGIDYANSMTFHRGFPAGTEIRWRWPMQPSTRAGVRGYNFIGYGGYSGFAPLGVAPQRVRDIRRYLVRYGWRAGATNGEWNLLIETYLNSAADRNDQVLEIGFFAHVPPRTAGFIASARPLGTCGAWSAALHERYAMFRRSGDSQDGTIDMVRILACLRSWGVITGNEWLPGMAMGVEPVTGTGTLRVGRFEVIDR